MHVDSADTEADMKEHHTLDVMLESRKKETFFHSLDDLAQLH